MVDGGTSRGNEERWFRPKAIAQSVVNPGKVNAESSVPLVTRTPGKTATTMLAQIEEIAPARRRGLPGAKEGRLCPKNGTRPLLRRPSTTILPAGRFGNAVSQKSAVFAFTSAV